MNGVLCTTRAPRACNCRDAAVHAAVWNVIVRPASYGLSRSLFRILTAGRSTHVCAGSRSTDDALSDLKRAVQGTTLDPLYLEGASYLKTLGIVNQAEIARVLDIAMNPKSLFLTYRDYKRAFNASARPLQVEKDMKPVVEFLIEKGASSNDLIRMIVQHPPILSYDVETRLRPFWDYLTSIGVADVLEIVIKRPSLMGLDADANIKKMVEYLRYIETPEDQILKYLETCL